MLLKFLSFLIITLFSVLPLWARATADVEREFDAFALNRKLLVSKPVQFLKNLTDRGQYQDALAILNKGDGVRGFNKENRKLTDDEAKIALNALFGIKKVTPNSNAFPEKIDDSGIEPRKRHRHFLKVAWRLLDTKLGHVATTTDFTKDNEAFIRFRTLVRAQMQFENTDFNTYDPYLGEGGVYLDNGVGKTSQYGIDLPQAPFFHAYNPVMFEDGIGAVSSTIRFKLPTEAMKQLLPANIRKMVQSVPDHMLDIFVVSQDLPWNSGVDILYRPQSWLDPEAPYSASDYNHAFDVTLWSMPTPKGNTIAHSEGPISDSVNTHTMETETDLTQIVSSGDHPSAGGVLNAKKDSNFTLFTLTRVDGVPAYNPARGRINGPGKHALTLHLILNRKANTGFDITESQKLGHIARILSEMRGTKKIYHFSEMLDADPVLSQLYRLGF